MFERAEMGLPFRITLYAEDALTAKAAAEAAFERIAVLNSILSDYESDSELTRLSRSSGQGKAVPVSTVLWQMLERSQALAERTEGAFDITVGPLVNTWRRARRKQELPSPELVAEMKSRVGYKSLRLDPQAYTAELLKPDMRLDLGAIAKGFAIDEALKVLKERGIRRALVGGSGDMAAGDPPPGHKGWRIEVAALELAGAPLPQVVLLANNAIATSGDVFQRVELDGKRYSHIVDPRTGIGLTDHGLVTIVASDCATADSLATAVSVLGLQQGLDLVEATPSAAARIARRPSDQIEFRESRRWSEVQKLRTE